MQPILLLIGKLLSKLRVSEDQAFPELVRRHYDVVYRFALLTTGDSRAATSLTREAFLGFVRENRERFGVQSESRLRVMSHVYWGAIDENRSAKGDAADNLNARQKHVLEILDEFEVRERAIFAFCYLTAASPEKIAKLTHTSAAIVERAIRRARERLRLPV